MASLEDLHRIGNLLPTSVRRLCKQPATAIAARAFYKKHAHFLGQRKIIYALTPPSTFTNIGDHAQALAIHQWMRQHWPDMPVIEVDKIETLAFIKVLKNLVEPEDLIFLHSGGNLSDRAELSENARRLVIKNFPENRLLSLPQTIFFSKTDNGNKEREKTVEIYGKHKYLTITGRDVISYQIAKEMFPNANVLAAPDFALSLPRRTPEDKTDGKVLFILRQDNESALGERRGLLPQELGIEGVLYDTETETPILRGQRETYLDRALNHISGYSAVITDRYHGLIFSVLCGKPTVVLPTVDHKLTSVSHWFQKCSTVAFSSDVRDVKLLLLKVCSSSEVEVDWNREFFESYASKLKKGLATR